MNSPIRATPALAIALLAAPLDRSAAQTRQQNPISIARLKGTITLDGMSDEPAWQLVSPLPAGQSSPNFGAPPSERTEFRIAYDDRYLYASGRMYDSDPGGIRATSLRRDDGSFSNDWFVVNIDSYNDKETMLVFGTNPAGIRTDVVFTNDAINPPNFSWNAFWDSAVRQTGDGWFAEIRIPLSSIRFTERDGRAVLGVTIWRRIARKNEMIGFPAVSPEWGTYSLFKASQAQEMELEDVHHRTPVYVTPYALGGDGNASLLAPDKSGYLRTTERPRQGGGDLKVGLTNDLTLDATYNTDFAQVEADDQQVNLTRFSLFFPEKRPFFQERSNVFDFGVGGPDQLFYSRRIGLSGGTPVPLYGGARLVGRAAGWDIGFLEMQTEPMSATSLPSQNFGVARVRRQVINPNSYVGGLFTSVQGGNTRNIIAEVDGFFRVRPQDFLTIQVGHESDNDTTPFASPDRLHTRFNYERRGVDGFYFSGGASRAGVRFIPALGYLQRTNFIRTGGNIGYGWRQPATSSVLRYSLSANGFAYRRNVDGRIETVNVNPLWSVELKSGRIFSLGVPVDYEDLRTAFSPATNVTVPAGSYQFERFTAGMTAPTGNLMRIDLAGAVGPFYDGSDRMASITPTWIASRHLELSGLYQVDRVEFPSRGQSFTAQIGRVRARTAFNSSTSFATFVQYNGQSDAVITNARFRYNPREGTDFYVVFNEVRNTRRTSYTPIRPETDSRTLLIKLSRTLDIEF